MQEPVDSIDTNRVTLEPLEIGALARQHYEVVYRFCARRVGIDWAADIAQDTFLTAQKNLHRFRRESSTRTWLLGIALNECRNTMRRMRLQPSSIEFDLADAHSNARESAWVDRVALSHAFNALSEEHRDVVILHELEGMTYEEIAVIVGSPVGTVKSRLHHAFVRLRELLRGKETS
jgi:RNA polymerase sigma-70 factor (ECF subfamily)